MAIAREKSTYNYPISFTDEDGTALVPNTIDWSLLYSDDAIVNSREDVSVAVPAASINITLLTADLALKSKEDYIRKLVIKIDYDSTLGSGLKRNDYTSFSIKNIPNVA